MRLKPPMGLGAKANGTDVVRFVFALDIPLVDGKVGTKSCQEVVLVVIDVICPCSSAALAIPRLKHFWQLTSWYLGGGSLLCKTQPVLDSYVFVMVASRDQGSSEISWQGWM